MNGLGGATMFATEAFEHRHELLVDFIEAGLIAGAAQGIVVVGEDAVGAGLSGLRLGLVRARWAAPPGHLRQLVSRATEAGWALGEAGVAEGRTPPRR